MNFKLRLKETLLFPKELSCTILYAIKYFLKGDTWNNSWHKGSSDVFTDCLGFPRFNWEKSLTQKQSLAKLKHFMNTMK
jgi:hypothetical protein